MILAAQTAEVHAPRLQLQAEADDMDPMGLLLVQEDSFPR